MLTGEGDKEKVNFSRKDCIMMILAMEAGLDIPEVLFEVGLVNNCEQRERVIYFCILFYMYHILVHKFYLENRLHSFIIL